jgi:hypothetical protein
MDGASFSIDLFGDMKLSELRTLVAKRAKPPVPPESLVVLCKGREFSNDATVDELPDDGIVTLQKKSAVSGPQSYDVLTVTVSGAKIVSVTITPTSPLSDVEALLKRGPPLAGLQTVFKTGDLATGARTDISPATKIGDIDFTRVQLVLEEVRAQAESDVQIGLATGVIPRYARFKVRLSDPISSAEGLVRQKWNIGAMQIQFALLDGDTGVQTPIAVATAFQDIDFDQNTLIVVQRPAEEPPPAAAAGPVDDGVHAPDAVGANGIVLRFKKTSDGVAFSLGFAKDETVRDAKMAVAHHCRVPSLDYITLLLLGKALQDTYVLGRLRLGNREIAVYVKDTSEVLLTSAIAMRTSVREGI